MNEFTKKQLDHRIQQALLSLDSVYILVNDRELLMMKRKLKDLHSRHFNK